MKEDYDVFVSYNRKDEEFVHSLIGVFDKYNIKYFVDRTELKLYDKLDASLKKNVYRSKYLLSLISPAYLNSYWCLFEAIEAIQLQQIEVKYLPIFLRYTNSDPIFDEDYIIERLSELSIEIDSFELKMLKNKAYDLGVKIDKLNFIKSNLPKIFIQIQSNVYPVFELYNQKSLLMNLQGLIDYIKPDAKVVLDLTDINLTANVKYDYSKPTISSMPQVKWATYVGKVKAKNSPKVLGNNVFIGTCGDEKNKSDNKDGVYCIDITTGRIKWHCHTSNDINDGLYLAGALIYGCINGDVYCISTKDGKVKWNINLKASVFLKPFVLYGDSDLYERVFLVNYQGEIFLVNTTDGSIEGSWTLNFKIRADALITKEPLPNGYLETYIYFSGEDGMLLKACYNSLQNTFEIIWSRNYEYPNSYNSTGLSRCGFYSSPVENNGQIIQAFVGSSSCPHVAMLSIDKLDGSVLWIAKDTDRLGGTSGNLRTQPVIVDDEIIYADAYSNSLKSISAVTGEFLWKIDAGRYTFEQWSSPVLYEGSVFLARHEGHLSKLNLKNKKKEWSMYLGDHADAGTVFDESQVNLEQEKVWWEMQKGFPIYSTPLVSRNHLLIGTDEGYIYCISNIT